MVHNGNDSEARTVMKAVAVLVAILCACTAAAATVYKLTPDGDGAFDTIQEAIDAASDGDVIILGPGRYHGDGNRDIDFRGKALIVQAGGGDPLSVVIDAEGSSQEPHRGFYFHSGEGSGSLVFGITISGGWPGGGMFDELGGAIYVDSGCSPTIACCRIEGNHAVNGAGLYSWHGSPTVDRCLFLENVATNNGGGAYCFGGDPVILNCTFISNEAERGGGIALVDVTTDVQSTVFAGNMAGGMGGAVYLALCDVTLTRCTLCDNSAFVGSAIASPFYGDATLLNTLVCFNRLGYAVRCESGGTVSAQCCNVYGHPFGDWIGCLNDQDELEGNVSSDPFLCSDDPIGEMDWSIRDDSPCAPDVSECGLIGAHGVECYSTPILKVTWGNLKTRFR